MKQSKRVQNSIQIKRITWIGILVNLFLAGIKFLVGSIGASRAVIADGVHSLSDMATDFAVIFGVKFWTAPPDEEHPYGHLRIETLITTAIGLTLAVVAIGLGYKSLMSLRETHLEPPGWIALIGPLISIVFKEILYRWTIVVGIRTKSSAVAANAWHHRSDALSSLPALIAVVASVINPNWSFVDHIGALIISIFILKVSWDIIRPSLSELTDQGGTIKDRERIKKIALEVVGVKAVHAIRTRKFGSNLHVDLHILVEPDISVRLGHDISEDVKKELIKNGPKILDVVVHLEPYD